MYTYRPNLQSHYQRKHRLAVHSGILALRYQQKPRRLAKRLKIAGASSAGALLVLLLFLLYPFGAEPVRVSQTPGPSLAGVVRHIAGTGAPRIEPLAPTVTTPTPKPQSKPKPAAPSVTTSIVIKGDDSCKQDTLAALKLLADKAPSHYQTVTTYIAVIECVTQGSGMAAYENPPRYLVGDATRKAGTIWYAGTIAHDAGHSRLYHDYQTAHPGQPVPSDVWTGQAAEATCLAAQHDALQQIGADQGTLDYVQNIINSDYWNVPYSERWW